MSDWDEVKKSVKPVALRARAPGKGTGDEGRENFRSLRDRLPRPRAVGIQAKEKRGHEISGAQMADLRSGKTRIDTRIDLHGMTQVQAFRELGHFMNKQISRGARLLLVITGKGKNNEGVLRNALPGWLMAGDWKRHVLTLHPAHQRHGGDGATYVLLRRQIKQQQF